eukprot:scaffold2636_cov340-Pavlova_lutheri.AAC.161
MNGKLCATNWTSSERDQPYASRTTPLAWPRFRDRAVLLFELAKPMESLSESWCRQSMTGRLSEDNLLSLGALRKFHFLPCMHNKRKDRTVKYSNVSLFKFVFRATKTVASHVGNDRDCGRCSY